MEYTTKKIVPPKSKNGYRKVPLKTGLYQELMLYKSSLTAINISNKVFTDKYLGQNINNKLHNVVRGTKYEGLTSHDFRHSFITNLVQNNVDVKTVAYIAGDNIETILVVVTIVLFKTIHSLSVIYQNVTYLK